MQDYWSDEEDADVEIERAVPNDGVFAPACDEDGFQVFDGSVSIRRLPLVVFSDDLREQQVWEYGRVVEGRVQKPRGDPDLVAHDPIVMSPAYLGWSIEPYEHRYLHYMGVGIVFARPSRGTFMQPSIDTLLVCQGLDILFARGLDASPINVHRAVDVGSGSGFIGKFIAAHAPGEGPLHVTLVDIDPAAMTYSKSKAYGALVKGRDAREVAWDFCVGDAVQLLDSRGDFDLIVANPPYIPTSGEVNRSEAVNAQSGFWEGIGLVVYLIDLVVKDRCPRGSHLVIQITSLTLRSPRVCQALEEAKAAGICTRILVEREIGWKAWYAGPGSTDHLMATREQRTKKQLIGDCEFFVGATEPGDKRLGGHPQAPRGRSGGFHWHVGYVLHVHRPE